MPSFWIPYTEGRKSIGSGNPSAARPAPEKVRISSARIRAMYQVDPTSLFNPASLIDLRKAVKAQKND